MVRWVEQMARRARTKSSPYRRARRRTIGKDVDLHSAPPVTGLLKMGRGAAVEPEAGAAIEDLFRSIVVVRGATPMPPRDLIPLHVPLAATQSV